MKVVRRFPALALLAACLLLSQAACAAEGDAPGGAGGPPPDGGPRQPPPEAVAACKGRAAGTTASFTDRGGRRVSGTCTLQGDVLAVWPKGEPGGAGRAASAPQ